jgi:hypothetical protein
MVIVSSFSSRAQLMNAVPIIDDRVLSPRAMSPMNYEEVLAMGRTENELSEETRSVDQEPLDVSLQGC